MKNAICSNMDGPRDYHTKQSKLEIQIPYDITYVWNLAAAAAKSRQSCPTLCDLIDVSPPGSPVPGILQARILEWVSISFNAWKWKVKVKSVSCVRLSATPWTAAYQAPPSMGFSRQEYWTGSPVHSLVESRIWHKWTYLWNRLTEIKNRLEAAKQGKQWGVGLGVRN